MPQFPTIPAEPPPLPRPPFFEHLLLEEPLPLVILLAAAGLIILWRARSALQRRRPLLLTGSALLTAAAAIAITGSCIQTGREQIRSGVLRLVQAAATADSATLDALMAPDCRLFTRYQIPGYSGAAAGMDKATILEQVAQTHRVTPITQADPREPQCHLRGPSLGSTQLLVHTVIENQRAGYKFPIDSWWRVDWSKDPAGQWRASQIELLSLPSGIAR